MSIQDVTRIIQTIIRPSKLPVYIHCLDGADVTGAVICCLRRLQAWHKDAVDSEFLRYSRTGEMSGENPTKKRLWALQHKNHEPFTPNLTC